MTTGSAKKDLAERRERDQRRAAPSAERLAVARRELDEHRETVEEIAASRAAIDGATDSEVATALAEFVATQSWVPAQHRLAEGSPTERVRAVARLRAYCHEVATRIRAIRDGGPRLVPITNEGA